jgi:hypothetical protein
MSDTGTTLLVLDLNTVHIIQVMNVDQVGSRPCKLAAGIEVLHATDLTYVKC